MKNLFITILLIISIKTFTQESQYDGWTKGVEYLKNGDYITGIEYMDDVLKHFPSPGAHYNRGIALMQLGDVEAACEELNTAGRMDIKVNKRMLQFLCDDDYKAELLSKEYYEGIKLKPENGYRPHYGRVDTLRGALRFERTCFDVYFYNLSVRILPATKSIRGNNEIYFTTTDTTSRIQLDLNYRLYIDSIMWNSKYLNLKREVNAIWVNFPEKLAANQKEKITVYYHGTPREAPKPPWDGGLVWKKAGLNQFNGVACEQLGASIWWPTKDHLSDRPDSMGINIEVPRKYQAVCNGRLRNVVDLKKDKYKRYEWFVDYPINNYNATFYMGKYVEFTDTLYTLGDTLVCRYHVLKKHLDVAKSHFKQAHEVIDFYNRTFGPFPPWKDNFRMVESPYEGMEHQTAIAYGDAFNNTDNSKTYLTKDYDYIIVHEAAHEWWGNSLTAIDMADAWLHEGFATYAEFLFIEEKHGHLQYLKEVQNHSQYIFNFWPMVQNRDVNENAFASGDIYTKGAAMLNSFRSTLADDSLFFGLIRGFFDTYRGKVIATQQFIDYVNEFTGINYTPFFSKYLYDRDIPVLHYTYKKKDNNIEFSYHWEGVPDGFEMPFALDLGNGETMRLVAGKEKQEVILPDTQTFKFFNTMANLDSVPKFGYTYYNTHCDGYSGVKF